MPFEDLFDVAGIHEFRKNATPVPKDDYLAFDASTDLDVWEAPKDFWKRLNGNYHTYKGKTIPTPCTLEWCIHTANYYANKPNLHTKANRKFMLIGGVTLQTWAQEANCDVLYLIAAILTSKYADTAVGKFARTELNSLT